LCFIFSKPEVYGEGLLALQALEALKGFEELPPAEASTESFTDEEEGRFHRRLASTFVEGNNLIVSRGEEVRQASQ
jgi:hypothetical protein